LTKNGTKFDPLLIVDGFDELKRLLATGKGVLLISPHTVLSLLMIRLFHDAQLAPVIITADPQMRVSGTTTRPHILQPSPTFLVVTRTKLRGGKLVCAMPDRGEPTEGRTVEFDTVNGRIILATPLMQVAARCGANVMFLKVHVEERGIVATMVSPSPSSANSADAITGDFIKFVREHVEDRFAYRKSASDRARNFGAQLE
jgi:hypothetical protein